MKVERELKRHYVRPQVTFVELRWERTLLTVSGQSNASMNVSYSNTEEDI